MEQIKFIETPKCKDCAQQLENSSLKQLSAIVPDRLKLAKCNQCNRLDNVRIALQIKGMLDKR